MSRRLFEAAAADAAAVLGTVRTIDLAGLLARHRGLEHVLLALQDSTATETVTALYAAVEQDRVPYAEAAAYLRGFVAGASRNAGEIEARTFWSGPATPAVPARAAAQVLIQVVREAHAELLAMTYSARAYRPLVDALRDAVARGVDIHVVVETLAGARGLLSGGEPAEAFTAISRVKLWHWPMDQRRHRHSLQHAKLAVADGALLWLGSANLTESGVRRNLEAGLLVRGGSAPQRAAEHVRDLQRRGVLQRLDHHG
ncbi:DISARM system phospholipase D-like protein DrmC [Streptomyces synnematoformans]|uniref:phospholipase D n=1 Tax=Streptomyces synnematoformans TaxID=415721 RepID=A0ABN2XDV0_9ACTN